MKKFLIAAVLMVSLLPMADLSAKSFGKTRVGLMLGGTSSSVSVVDVDAESISQFHGGLTAQFPLGMGFSVQPGLVFQRKGMSLNDWKGDSGSDFKTNVGYLEVPVQIQWGPDLLLFRPYLFAEPFLGYRLGYNQGYSLKFDDPDAVKLFEEEPKKIEYGLGIGAGIDIWIFQVSAKYFWNFGSIYKTGSTALDTIKGLKEGNNFSGIAFSVSLFF